MRFGLAHVGLVVSALLAAAVGMSGPAALAVLALVSLAGGHALALRWRLGIALAAWAIWTGFFENSLGLLTFSGPDLARVVALGVLAAALHTRARGWDRLGP